MAQINKPNLHFNTVLYTGNGGTQSITGVGFQPDWVWIKRRNSSGGNMITDVVRGVTNTIVTNETSATQTLANGLTAFGTDGFTVGSESGFNGSSDTFVSFNWKAANSAGSANTDGSISSTVSVNTTAGFSIVKYVGNATSGATVGHGLGAAPDAMIIKNYSTSGAQWTVFNQSLGNTKGMQLDSTAVAGTSAAYWNNTSPSATVFTLGNGGDPNGNGANTIAYCFKSIKGYSKFGSYTGNGNADGTFIYTGFKPAWIMTKRATGSTNEWYVYDNKRTPTNPSLAYIVSNTNSAENNGSQQDRDMLSNGFKIRNGNAAQNASGSTYIYMAFAENPIVGTNNIPATAR